MRIFLFSLLFPACVFLMFSCGEKPADTIKLGVAGAHSGDLASYGIPSVRAAQLVVKKINAAGGVLGKQVELLIEDDACKPEIAGNTATKLISDGADVVLGHICSGATKAALGFYKDAGMVCMSPSATNPDLTFSGEYPNFFRTIANDAAQARLQVDFAVNVLKVKKVAILHDKGDYGKGAAELARGYFEDAGVQVILFEGITTGTVDYSAIVIKVNSLNPDAVIWGGYHPEASKIVTLMRKKNMDTPFIGPDGVKDATFISVAGEYAEGVYATGPVDISTNPMAILAGKEYQDAFGEEPGAFFDQAYAATLCLLNAIEKAGSTDYSAIVKSLHTHLTDTPFGKIKFDEKGDAIGVEFAVYKVENGVFTEHK
ncbi:MAG: branched-chain amino acid ABC transporter substrate-binding protein [Proteobacteria bacterium]|nr:branched-chain amino acid ABC transporter substrate-binding protein [Pseudomonadota bacterium]MBU1388467.1 branched-chain amino acid ABC transporter substrate-binding protein [Pseudomonadota bacterium]MBU1542709.1 branched-chain amino acid ABC transporter substrate-binding protein [Pseudomonadota bacterium]MBU2430855.1 branched-chain amino acid ABC transporter substrate-binding protein [Pseudomonadota bacterium]MBU2481243.1 branched-chain amino acid ABC transporter substrate-binding protein 